MTSACECDFNWPGVEPIFSYHWARGGGHPGEVDSPSQDHTKENHTTGEFRITNHSDMDIFGLWEEAEELGENPGRP